MSTVLVLIFGYSMKVHADSSTENDLSTINDSLVKKTAGDNSQTTVERAVSELTDQQKEVLLNETQSVIKKATTEGNDTGYILEEANLGNGFTVQVQSQDVSENQAIGNNEPLLRSSTSGHYDITKAYGNREYIITAGVNWKGLGFYSQRLNMHYTLSNSGIKMRYSNTAGSYSYVSGLSTSCKTTDFSATHVGANVNAYAKFTCSGILSTPAGAIDYVHGAVKITSWSKTNKNMKLHESWYLEK